MNDPKYIRAKGIIRVNFDCPKTELADFDKKIEGSGLSRSECFRKMMKGAKTFKVKPKNLKDVARDIQDCIDKLNAIATALFTEQNGFEMAQIMEICKVLEKSQGVLVSDHGI